MVKSAMWSTALIMAVRAAHPIQSELVQSELVQSELVQSELVQSELVQSELAQSELSQPELVQSELSQPELVQLKLAQVEGRNLQSISPSAGVDYSALEDANSRVICWGSRRDRIWAGASSCMSCSSFGYVAVRLLCLFLELGCYLIVGYFSYRLLIERPSLTHLGYMPYSALNSVASLGMFSTPHWPLKNYKHLNVLTLAYSIPGSWFPSNCLSGYENRLGAYSLNVVSAYLTIVVFVALIYLSAYYTIDSSTIKSNVAKDRKTITNNTARSHGKDRKKEETLIYPSSSKKVSIRLPNDGTQHNYEDRDYEDRDYEDRDYEDRDYEDRDYEDRDYEDRRKISSVEPTSVEPTSVEPASVEPALRKSGSVESARGMSEDAIPSDKRSDGIPEQPQASDGNTHKSILKSHAVARSTEQWGQVRSDARHTAAVSASDGVQLLSKSGTANQMADGIADEGDMACRGSFREAVLEFNKLHSMKEELNDELCRMVLDARAFYSLETDAYITPARVVLPPFTKGNLLRTIQNAFGDNYFEAVRLLIKYETVYQKMVLYRLLYRLIGIYPILPFTIRNTLRTILPTISLIWLSYLPKVILSMVMALSCIDTYDHLLGRQIYSAHCGYDAPKKMKKIVLQTFVGILGVIYILSIPIVITWTYDWHEITQFSRLSKGGRQARKGLEQRSRTSIRPGAIKLNIAATNKIATNKIATGSNIDDKLLSSNGPIRANLGRQTLSYQANIEDRILGGHFTTTIRPLAEIMLMGYKPSTWTILIAARFMIQGFVIIAPLSSNRLLFNIRLALMIKSLICLILIIKRPHTLRTFYGISICDLYGEFMMLGSIMFYEKINQTDDNVVFDFSTINSTKYQRWFITFIWLSIIGQLIIYLLITIYEYGKLISYTDYRWRSKLHKSGYNIPQNWFKKIYPKLSFQFFFKIAQILETRLIYNPTNKNLILKQFKPAGEDLPTSTNPLGKNDGYTLSLINHGLKALCSGRYSCMLHADTVSLLSRYCFEFIRKMREIYSETPSTLKELLKGLELMDMNKYHQDYIVELWLSGKDLISINNNNNGTINNNAGGTINNNNGTINNIFCDYYLSPLGTVRQFDISISETRWLRLITKRHAIRFASDCIDPSSFSYIEVLSTEFAMAIEHLVKLTPYMSSDLMASFIGVSYDQLIKERDLEKLELNKDVLIKQINNKIKSNGRNEEMMIMEYFQKVTELERLQKNCQSMYDSCVNAQIHVLENLGQDTELKLKQAGVKDQLLQESTCLRNVQTELETSRKPIDIFSYVLDDELTDDDDDEDLRMLKRRSTELNRVQVLPDDDDDQGQLMAGAAFDPTGIDPTGLYGIPDDDTSMIKPEYLKSEYLKSSSSSLDRPIGRRGGPREAYEKDHEIYSSSNSSDNEPYVLNPPAIGTEATVNDVFKATGTPQVVVMDLDQRKGKNHHTRSTFPEQEPPPAAADPAAGPTGDEPNLGWLQYVPEERLEEVIEHTLDDYEQPFTARDDNDDLESRRKYDVWEPN